MIEVQILVTLTVIQRPLVGGSDKQWDREAQNAEPEHTPELCIKSWEICSESNHHKDACHKERNSENKKNEQVEILEEPNSERKLVFGAAAAS